MQDLSLDMDSWLVERLPQSLGCHSHDCWKFLKQRLITEPLWYSELLATDHLIQDEIGYHNEQQHLYMEIWMVNKLNTMLIYKKFVKI